MDLWLPRAPALASISLPCIGTLMGAILPDGSGFNLECDATSLTQSNPLHVGCYGRLV